MKRKHILRNLVLVGVAVVVLFMALGSTRILPGSFSASPEEKAFAEQNLVPLDGDKVTALVREHQGTPSLLFLYASWCPYCKKQFPMLKALQSRYGEEELSVLYISLDDDPYGLSRFLMENYPNKPFVPYHVSPYDRATFDDAVAAYGFAPDGAIPHLLLFNAQGERVQEFKGLTPIPNLLEAIQTKAM